MPSVAAYVPLFRIELSVAPRRVSAGYGFDKARAFGRYGAMLRLWRKPRGEDAVARVHGAMVAASRRPELYGPGGFPDTVEGRFESLALHAILVFRRLRQLPPPADDLGQELVDALFAHLEIALRESGVGDFGVPKRMKKLAQAFYDRAGRYDPLLDGGDAEGLAKEIAARLEDPPGLPLAAAQAILADDERLRQADLEAIIGGSLLGGEASGAAGAEFEEARP